MKFTLRQLIAFIGISMFFFASELPAFAEELSGKQIIDEVSRRHDRPNEFETQIMTLIDSRGNEEKREVKMYSREFKGGLNRYLITFDSPAGVRGVALLTWQNEGMSDEQWTFLPALGRKLKRTAEGSKRNYFMGTDFANEDLVSEDRSKYVYERLEDQKLDGVDHFVVRTYPNTEDLKKDSGYKFRDFFVRKDIFFIMRTDYFDRRGRFLKRQTVTSKPYKASGEMYFADIRLLDNKKEKHQTRVEVIHRDLSEAAVPKANFTKRFLTSKRHMR
ncbi:MAG: outer membrane lipoprotein-sorting protein [Gallionellaceae bacterium]